MLPEQSFLYIYMQSLPCAVISWIFGLYFGHSQQSNEGDVDQNILRLQFWKIT